MKRAYLIISLVFCSAFNASMAEPSTSDNWKRIQIQVATITGLSNQFSKSVAIFAKDNNAYKQPSANPTCKVIRGDSNAETKNSEVTHIHGDLNSDIYLEDHSELIIGGNVNPYANIYVNGISRIFVGGDFKGAIIGKSTYSLSIVGNHSGLIETGRPSTKISVYGDFKGKLKPNEARGSLVSLQVFGFTDIETIKSLYEYQYTQFNGVFYNSNAEPGIYQTQPPLHTYYTIVNKENNMYNNAFSSDAKNAPAN